MLGCRVRHPTNQQTSKPPPQQTTRAEMNPQTNQKTVKKSTKNPPKWLQNRSWRLSWVPKIDQNRSKICLGGCLGEVWDPSWPQEPTRPPKVPSTPLRPPLLGANMEAKIDENRTKIGPKWTQFFDLFFVRFLIDFGGLLGGILEGFGRQVGDQADQKIDQVASCWQVG